MKDASWLMAGIFLLYSSYSDLRCGMISVKSCLIAAGAGAAARVIVWMKAARGTITHEMFVQKSLAQELSEKGIVWDDAIWVEFLRDLLPGLFVMGLAIGSGEQIGKGDAWIILALGLLVGARKCMSLFVTALIISVPFSFIWRFSRKHRNGSKSLWEHSFPFVPNLFFSYVLLSFFA